MTEFGYDAALITEGKTLLTETRQAFDLNVTEDDETSEMYVAFKLLKTSLENTYSLDRKKQKLSSVTTKKHWTN